MTHATVSDSTQVDASPDAVWSIVTDLDQMAELTEESTGVTWEHGDALTPGSVFRGSNRNGWRRWSTTCTVTDADPARLFAFEVTTVAKIPVARWSYELTPHGEGTTVTESMWDKRPGWFKGPAGLATGVKDREAGNADHIARTLKRLKAHAER